MSNAEESTNGTNETQSPTPSLFQNVAQPRDNRRHNPVNPVDSSPEVSDGPIQWPELFGPNARGLFPDEQRGASARDPSRPGSSFGPAQLEMSSSVRRSGTRSDLDTSVSELSELSKFTTTEEDPSSLGASEPLVGAVSTSTIADSSMMTSVSSAMPVASRTVSAVSGQKSSTCNPGLFSCLTGCKTGEKSRKKSRDKSDDEESSVAYTKKERRSSTSDKDPESEKK